MKYIFPEPRKHQLSTLEKIKASSKKFIILYASTGSGKSFFPGQLVHEGNKVLSLVATKSLQTQYANYNMSVLYGKGNYDCLKQVVMFGEQTTANDCEIKNKGWCNENCPYPLTKTEFLASNGGVLNYAKFLLDQQLVKEFNSEYLFLDEAHLLSDIVLGYAGIEFYWKSKQLAKYYPSQFPIGLPQPLAYPRAIEWLRDLLINMNDNKPISPQRGGNLYTYRWHKYTVRKAHATLNFMVSVPESWHIESDNKRLLIKPKTARFNFIDLFDKAEKVILMSATLDKHMLRELGVKDYQWIEVPNLWPGPLRPVIDLKAPKMGYSSSEDDWSTHADKIAHALNKRPSEHTGLIHTPSKKLAHSLASRLGKLSDRKFFVPDNDLGTEEVYDQWLNIKGDGTICVYWGAWEGWDCGKDHINIIAKTPFVNFADGYDKARFLFDGKAGYSRVAAKFQQGLGRIRRGNSGDYGSSKFVGIADGNWTRIKKYFDDVFIV